MAPKVSVVPHGLCQAGPNIHACGLWEALSGFYICLCFAAGRPQYAALSFISAEEDTGRVTEEQKLKVSVVRS